MNVQQQFAEKVSAGIFEPVRRHLSTTAADNDRFEEGLAQTWRFYADRTGRGDVPPNAILVTHCRRRATDTARTLVGAEGRHRKCPLDPRSFQKGKAEVTAFDEVGGAVLGNACPESALVSAIDLGAWLSDLDETDLAIVSGRAEGRTLKEIARRVGLSFSGVNGRLKRLGGDLLARVNGITANG